jgi:hypothetical protein
METANPRFLVRAVRAIVLISLVLIAVRTTPVGAQGLSSDTLRDTQIAALQTLDTSRLLNIRSNTLEVKLAIDFTQLAVDELSQAVKLGKIPKVSMSAESARLTSDFIRRGATRAVREDPAALRIEEARQNLTRFIDRMIEMAMLENGKFGETTYSKATSLCPLWPFCD